MSGFDLKWARGKFPELKETDDRLQAKRRELKTIFDEAGPELDPKKVKSVTITDGTDLHEVVKAYNDELVELKDALDKHVDTAKAAYGVLNGGEGGEPAGEPGAPAPTGGPVKSIGQLFVESDAFGSWRRGQTSPVATIDMDVRQLFRPRATLFETGTGWAPESTRTGIVTEFPTRPAPQVVDFIPQIPTGQSSVKYMEETTFTNAAAETAEGGAYGEAALALTEKTVDVRKVTVWLPVTDEQLEDEPQARGYVEMRLVFMLRQRVDGQVLVGNGVAPNLLGTENVTGIQTQALGTDPIFDAFYKLFTKIRDDGFAEPSVFFIRPAKWQTARLARTADGIYILGNPADPGPTRMWGVPGVETTAAPATKALAGDYVTHSFIAPRRGVDVQVSNSHSTDFVNGKQAIRADVRLAMVHLRPKAFGEITGL